MRWLHIYLSMACFAIVFFFAVTGWTLNHADKFGGEVRSKESKGKLDPAWVHTPDTNRIARLELVEYFRNNFSIHAALSDFRIDETQCSISFKGPGYAADAFIDRGTGNYDIVQTSGGFVGLINDLHKGRDTGRAWSLFIDGAAILLALVSLTGMLLLLYLKRRRMSGIITAILGLIAFYVLYLFWIK
jgi:hypothetical protein